jgi:hypothetical protein
MRLSEHVQQLQRVQPKGLKGLARLDSALGFEQKQLRESPGGGSVRPVVLPPAKPPAPFYDKKPPPPPTGPKPEAPR